jgi:hypothetical protein
MIARRGGNLLRAGQPSVLAELAAGDPAAQAVGAGVVTFISILSKESGVLGAAAWFLYERSRSRFG